MSQLNIWNYELPAQEIADMARSAENIVGNVVAWSDFHGPADKGVNKIEPSAARKGMHTDTDFSWGYYGTLEEHKNGKKFLYCLSSSTTKTEAEYRQCGIIDR